MLNKIAKNKVWSISVLILIGLFFVGCNRYSDEETYKAKMTMNLEFSNDQIIVSALMFPKVDNNEFSFVVNNLLAIDEISSTEGILKWKRENISLDFRPELQKITVTTDSDSAITIKYHGKIDGWFNFIKPDKKALSSYSAWYPQEFSFPADTANEIVVKMSNLSDFDVINGEYSSEDKNWVYTMRNDRYDDCNIIAFKKGEYSVLSQEGVNIYYCNKKEAASATAVYDYCIDVLKYYNDILYCDNNSYRKKLNIVSFSEPGSQNGAYTRDGLIVLDGLSDMNQGYWMKAVFPHELAHFWTTGADTSSFEDWLNETMAEWSALLYLLYSNNQDTFDQIINDKTKQYSELPAIKTVDGSRPEGVHTKGTILFYDIYQKYGTETIQKLLTVFVSLDEKNTENFINEVSSKVGNDIAIIIREGIDKK